MSVEPTPCRHDSNKLGQTYWICEGCGVYPLHGCSDGDVHDCAKLLRDRITQLKRRIRREAKR